MAWTTLTLVLGMSLEGNEHRLAEKSLNSFDQSEVVYSNAHRSRMSFSDIRAPPHAADTARITDAFCNTVILESRSA